MTSSGTTDFFLSNSDIAIEAMDRAGIRPTSLTRQQMIGIYRSLNLVLSALNNAVPNLWTVDLQEIPLLAGVSTYDILPNTIAVLDVYVRDSTITEQPNDIVLLPISRTDYSMIPTKEEGGKPTSFWYDRLLQPQITVWPVPTEDDLFTLRFYRTSRIEDSNLKMGQTPAIPIRFLEAVCAETAARVAMKYAPDRYTMLKADAMEKMTAALVEDRERVPIYIGGDFSAYYS